MKSPTELHGFPAPQPLRPYSKQVTLDPVLRHTIDKSVWFQTAYFNWPELSAVPLVNDKLILTERFK